MSPVSEYGTWDSPLSPAGVAAQRVSRSSLASGAGALWWLEGRPEEAGRVVLVRGAPGAEVSVVSPAAVSIRSRVHEYGGAAWCLLDAEAGSFAYVEETSQRVYAAAAGVPEAVALTPEPPAGERWHHGGLAAGPAGGVLAVSERHREGRVERQVVRLDPGRPGTVSTLLEGRDFYASLAVSPGGDRLAFVAWDHPNMPWDATELWVADLGGTGAPERVGAGVLDGSSVDQPVWLEDGSLAFVADARGWWQPWRWRPGAPPVPLSDLEAEFQGPAWNLGHHTLVALGPGRLGCVWERDGTDRVGTLAGTGRPEEIAQPCVAASSLCAHDGGLAWLGATASDPPGVWRWSGRGQGSKVAGPPPPLEEADVSPAEALSVPGPDGRPVHAHLYAPRRAGWRGPDGTAPPLIVHCHGGPTGAAGAGFDPVVQLFTTRGYAVAAVNYAGSTGYGRAYRRALEGRWGVADVDDCVAVARWLAEAGRVDGARLAIRGASAGGLTALGALVRADVFCAAVSMYGVTDLMGLVRTTHDFESRYTDRLVGPLPEAAERYRERSPLFSAEAITGAVLLLQGEDDPVVPPEQTRSMAEALAARGVRCEVRYFAGESHGFRRADTLTACFEAELAFYAEVLGPGPGGPR